MKQNIVFLFGTNDSITKYIDETLNSERIYEHHNAYVLLSLLNKILGIENIHEISNFFSNDELKSKKKVDYFQSVGFSSDVKLMINDLIKEENKEKFKKNKDIYINYDLSENLLERWLKYIYEHRDKLSIQKSLEKKRTRSPQKYKIEFLNKNMKSNVERSDYEAFFKIIGEIFNEFIQHGDKAGFKFLVALSEDDTYKNKKFIIYINACFVKAFTRKMSKLALDWVNEETEFGKQNSIINSMRFITDYIDDTRDDNQRMSLDNTETYKNRKNLSYDTIGYSYYPITFSEYRYFKKQNYLKNKNIITTQTNKQINK
ncbi:hypothetical protein [Xenorhabdus ishibashii]|uniref:Uncharacterized protein n=1 Tax=Xenorhabdus ishibashii TaxID=1034471 RepID=A0A2D0KAB0_9GAMM|nr:hypothetical protein [Xenorhabdus ishibashii]PHM60376.1 hypothetical protein Xish_03523 [Xenorhabdus ishibashii]